MRSTLAADDRTVVVAAAGTLIAVAVTIGWMEAVMLPAGPVPGVRLGLANVAVLVAFAWFGARPAAAVAAGKVLLVGLATGSLLGPSGLLSAAGTIAAWFALVSLGAAGDRFSPLGLGVGASAAHVAAQFGIATAVIGSTAVLGLLPLALAASVPMGLATGWCAALLIDRVPLALAAGRERTVSAEGVHARRLPAR